MNNLSQAEERKDFPDWVVTLVYKAQEGVCANANCLNPLEKGFHRHHKDKDNTNNTVENLELLCIECHRSTYFKEQYEAHKTQERDILYRLNLLLTQGFEGKLSGAHMERMLEAMTMSLKVSRSINSLDVGVEYPPPSIQVSKRLLEMKFIEDKFVEIYGAGIKEGVRIGSTTNNPSSVES